jgi:proteasome lid subunit RPN8/RPN11
MTAREFEGCVFGGMLSEISSLYWTGHSLSGIRTMRVEIDRELLRAMLSFARERHPNEIILLLRGETSGGAAVIEEFLFPPFGTAGRGFAEFRPHMLPIDFSIIGTAHSHPSGPPLPSPTDLNNFYAKIMLILAHPYAEETLAAFNARGEVLPLSLTG